MWLHVLVLWGRGANIDFAPGALDPSYATGVVDGAEDFILDPLAHRQPVELGKQWGGSRVSRVLRHQAGSVVLENMLLAQLLCRGVCK